MTRSTQSAFIDQVQSLPPLPVIVHRILEVTNSPDSSAEDVSQALSRDQAIAAKILRVANSPFYGLGRQVSQLSRAVVLLGSRAVRNMVLGICARDTLARGTHQSPEHAAIWEHSIAVAAASDLIGRRAGLKVPEEAFVAGLLHDTGRLAMAILQPESFRKLFNQHVTQRRLLAMEREYFGVDHTEAGFRILTDWRLPEKLCCVARQHHRGEPILEDSTEDLLPVVMLADTMAHVMGIGLDTYGEDFSGEEATRVLNLAEKDVVEIFAGLEQRIDQVFEMLGTKPTPRSQSQAAPTAERVLWITSEQTKPCYLRLQLLERCGYQVKTVSPAQLEAELSDDGLILVGLGASERSAACALACQLAKIPQRKIAILCDLDEQTPARQRDPQMGLCQIPRFFTALDIQWLQEQLQR